MKVGAVFIYEVIVNLCLYFILITLAKNLEDGLHLIIYVLLQGIGFCLNVEVWKKLDLISVKLL